ncbi:amidohydrolase family protein [Candidatus Soleaferrea massiliensis]|uniref:amidohydrolase family protein n=1 Tax=Candidatus Soleaferrea massiliensis TaxID=1470354 RepID=UPI00058E749F|nr:amidohydrolase family protein [Candidatus Soleaferrea massiliensis]
MVIDFHTHIFADNIAKRAIPTIEEKGSIKAVLDGTKPRLLASMEEAGIDKSVVLPIATKPGQTRTINEWAAREQDDKTIFFGTLHPDNEDYKEHIRFIAEQGFKGVKLHPDYQDFFVDDERMYPIYYEILSAGLMLMFHAGLDVGYNPPYHCVPKRLRTVLDTMQGGVIIAAHLGGQSMWHEVEKYLVGRNVYFDTSMGLCFYPVEQFERIVNNHNAKMILFGTDSPWDNQAEELQRMRETGLTPEQLDCILYKNAERLLSL